MPPKNFAVKSSINSSARFCRDHPAGRRISSKGRRKSRDRQARRQKRKPTNPAIGKITRRKRRERWRLAECMRQGGGREGLFYPCSSDFTSLFLIAKSGDGAAVVVVVEHDLAEVGLAASLFGRCGGFGASCWRTPDPADSGAGDDFGGFAVLFNEQGIELFLSERDYFRRVGVVFLPDFAVEITGRRRTSSGRRG